MKSVLYDRNSFQYVTKVCVSKTDTICIEQLNPLSKGLQEVVLSREEAIQVINDIQHMLVEQL